jgi:hypothetical protein
MPSYIPPPPGFGGAPSGAGGPSVADLIMHGAQARAQGAAQQGQIWGQAAGNLGQIAAGGLQAHQMAKRDAAWVSYIESGTWAQDPKEALAMSVRTWGPEKGPAQFQALQAVAQLSQPKRDPAADQKSLGQIAGAMDMLGNDEARARLYPQARALALRVFPDLELPPDFNPEAWQGLSAAGAQLRGGEGFTLSPGQQRFGANGQPVAAVAPEPPKPPSLQTVETAEGIRTFNPQTGEMGPVVARPKPNAPRDPDGGALVAVIGDDGQPVLVPRGQAVGRRPASNREQGRPVTSGDAGRIADLDTSLDDLNTLGATLTGNKATGAAAKAGAMLPNALTELTGWGTDAKQKQATIDRVKQVIGKALEGGVLRKEDEYKYEKILPTIGDPPAIVKTKLEGLWSAIQQRRGTTLDALQDAGYDTQQFQARAPRTPGGGSAPPAAAPSAPPAVGAVVNGYRFKGGDPASPSSWERP